MNDPPVIDHLHLTYFSIGAAETLVLAVDHTHNQGAEDMGWRLRCYQRVRPDRARRDDARDAAYCNPCFIPGQK